MAHFGISCPAVPGHLNPMTALGYELQKRGHRVTVFGVPDAQRQALAAGLDFCAIGAYCLDGDGRGCSPGKIERTTTATGDRTGVRGCFL